MFSIFILKERLYKRYIIGIIICIFGILLLISNEKSVEKDKSENSFIAYGLFFGFLNSITFGLQNTANKLLLNRKIENLIILFYTGVYIAVFSIIFWTS